MPYMTEAEVSNLHQIIERLEKENETLAARLQEAEAIIKPFASEAAFWGSKTPKDATPTIKWNNVGDEAAFTVGDLRAAAAFLESR